MSSYLGVTPEGDDWLPVLMNLVLECHGEAWKAHDHFGKSFSPAADVPKLTMASFEQDVYFVRQLLLEYTGEGSELDLTTEQAHAFRWHGAKATLTTVMMHLGVGDRAVRFSGNWKDVKETMPDTYLRESQLLVLDAQEQALAYLRGGGEVVSLEPVPLVQGTKERREGSEEVLEKRKEVEKPDFKGLSFSDVPKEVLEQGASHGGFDASVLESETETKVDQDDIDKILTLVTPDDNKSDAEEDQVEVPGTPEVDSDEEFYITGFLRVAPSLRLGSLHKEKTGDEIAPRCGQAGKRFEHVAAADSVERRTTFCQKCFGRRVNCDKLCSQTREVVADDGSVVVGRCMRRCCLDCENVAKFMDKDDRRHLCNYHRMKEEADKEDRDETEQSVQDAV